MSTQAKTLLTPDEYLAIEERAETKSEYYNGEMFAMAGGTWDHARLAAKLLALLIAQLGDGNCDAVGSDQRVLVRATGLYTYPDLLVVCGGPKLDRGCLLNPRVIVEILSPRTESYDRGRKFKHYKTIESLQEYLLVAQDRVDVDLYTRQTAGGWLLTSASKPEDTVELASIGCKIKLAELYQRVQFEPEPELPS